jgi:hypothetical protein
MRILAQHGAQWTAKAMDYLITWDRQWVTLLITMNTTLTYVAVGRAHTKQGF